MTPSTPALADIQIGWCPTHRIPDLQTLIDAHWRSGHVLARDEALLRWQYRHLCSPDELSIVIATDRKNDRIIGCLGLIQAPFNDHGTKRLALWMSMWLLVPEARGKGIGFALLDRAIRDGYDVIACVGFNDVTRRLVSRMGFYIQDVVPRWVRPVSLQALLSLTAARPQPYSDALRARWETITAGPRLAPAGLVVGSTQERLRGWGECWRKRLAPAYLSTWHDADYLRWRYLDHPSFDYEVLLAGTADGGGSPANGLLVYRLENVTERPERIIRIVELLGEPAVLDDLVAHVVERASAAGAAFVEFCCTAVAELGVLERQGFYRDDLEAEADRLPHFFQLLDFRPKPLNLTLWTGPGVHPDVHALVAAAELYFTRADGDQDRPN